MFSSDGEYSGDVGAADKKLEVEPSHVPPFQQRNFFQNASSSDAPGSNFRRFPTLSTKKNHQPKIEVEFTGVEEGHQFDFASEEIRFAYRDRLLKLYEDPEDDVKFEHFIIPTKNREPKECAVFDARIVDNLAGEKIITMRPSQIATMMVLFFGVPSLPGDLHRTSPPPQPDMICISTTGSGKTFAYLTPIVQKCLERIEENPNETCRSPTTLIFANTNSLVVNIFQRANKLTQGTGIKVELIAGGTKFLKNSHFDIGICTIGRFMTHFKDVRECDVKLQLENLKYLVVDEADLFSVDEDFRKIVFEIKKDGVQFSTLLFSATFNDTLYSLVNEDNYYIFSGGNFNQASGSIKQLFWPVSTKAVSKIYGAYCNTLNVGRYAEQGELRHPFDALFYFLQMNIFNKPKNKKKVIVFMKRTIVADITARKLCMFGFPAVSVHGKQAYNVRQILLQRFIDGEVRVLLATNLLTRGLDIDVEYVVNYDLPQDYVNWVHRCGRTGRNRKTGVAVTFIDQNNPDDYPLQTLQHIAMKADMTEAPLFLKRLGEDAKEQLEIIQQQMGDFGIQEEDGF